MVYTCSLLSEEGVCFVLLRVVRNAEWSGRSGRSDGVEEAEEDGETEGVEEADEGGEAEGVEEAEEEPSSFFCPCSVFFKYTL